MRNSWVNFRNNTVNIGDEEFSFTPFDSNLVSFNKVDSSDYDWVFDGDLLEDIESPNKDHFFLYSDGKLECEDTMAEFFFYAYRKYSCLLYTSPSPRDQRGSRMPSSA